MFGVVQLDTLGTRFNLPEFSPKPLNILDIFVTLDVFQLETSGTVLRDNELFP